MFVILGTAEDFFVNALILLSSVTLFSVRAVFNSSGKKGRGAVQTFVLLLSFPFPVYACVLHICDFYIEI